MTTPKISLVAFKERQGDFIFVAVPNERGRYVRTDASVVQAECSNCGAAIGEPCKNRHGNYLGGTHYQRRVGARLRWPRPAPDDVIRIELDDTSFPPIEFPETV